MHGCSQLLADPISIMGPNYMFAMWATYARATLRLCAIFCTLWVRFCPCYQAPMLPGPLVGNHYLIPSPHHLQRSRYMLLWNYCIWTLRERGNYHGFWHSKGICATDLCIHAKYTLLRVVHLDSRLNLMTSLRLMVLLSHWQRTKAHLAKKLVFLDKVHTYNFNLYLFLATLFCFCPNINKYLIS